MHIIFWMRLYTEPGIIAFAPFDVGSCSLSAGVFKEISDYGFLILLIRAIQEHLTCDDHIHTGCCQII